MLTMLTRTSISTALTCALEPLDFARAAWLGGSDATGRADDLSDLDLMLIVSPGHTEDAAAAIHQTLESLSPIRTCYRMPSPTWHGFPQAFYQLELAPEHLMIDWLILESNQPHPWLEVERHGTPRVLFDKDGLIKPAHTDRAAIAATVARRIPELELRFRLFRHLPPKLIARNLPAEAMHFYFSLVLRPLVDLYRCIHCPDRHDFGFRYIRADLPREAWELVERLSYVPSPADIPARVAEAVRAFDLALAEHRKHPRAPIPPAL